MKVIYIIPLISTIIIKAQLGSVGIGTAQPDPSAILDVAASNKGLMLPVVSLTSTRDITTVPNPKPGFIIYNKNVAGTGYTAVTKGLYSFNGTSGVRWEKMWTKGDIITEIPKIPFIKAVFAASNMEVSSNFAGGSTQNITFNTLHRNEPVGVQGAVGAYTGYTVQQNGRYVITYAVEVRLPSNNAGISTFTVLRNGAVIHTYANSRYNLFSGASNSYTTDLITGDVISFQMTVTGSTYQIANPNVSISKISNN